jgi:hypothetical protein
MLASLALSTNGCGGVFSYKRGADMTDFKQEKARCSKNKTTVYDFDKCLENSGWVVVGSAKTLGATQAHTTVNRNDSQHNVIQSKIEKPVDPLEKVTVSSWWKAGATPNMLFSDGDSCVLKLGENYKYEANMSSVTIGLIGCMKDKGWLSLKQE